jgi:hypothetical protein
MNQQQEKMVGNYTVIKQIGRGGHGAVFLSKSPITNAPAAIKLYPSKTLQIQGFMKRLSRELDIIQELDHPHIVAINGYDVADKFPAVDMPYMMGGNLETKIQRGTVQVADIKNHAQHIFQALIYAHRQGVIHGNLKPTNILFDRDNHAYVSDFQLDCLDQHKPYTPTAYTSPEQINGKEATERSDVYSLGMVLFAWISGQAPPYSPSSVSEKGYVPLSLRKHGATVSAPMDKVIQCATEYDPSLRYGSMKSFFQAFFEALRIDKFFLQVQATVSSDVTEFAETMVYNKTEYAPKGGRRWYDVVLVTVAFAVLGAIFRFSAPYVITLLTNPYEPAVIPDGYVLFSGANVEIAAPSYWIDVNSEAYKNEIADMVRSGDVNPELAALMSRGDFSSIQIFVASPNYSPNVNINVTRVGNPSLKEVQTTLVNEAARVGISVLENRIVELPIGDAFYMMNEIYMGGGSAISHAYVVIRNNNMYTVTFTQASASDVGLFDVMIDTFRIKS